MDTSRAEQLWRGDGEKEFIVDAAAPVVGSGAEAMILQVVSLKDGTVLAAKRRRVRRRKGAPVSNDARPPPPVEVVVLCSMPPHPRLVRVLGYFWSKDHVFTLMPLAPKDLFGLVQQSVSGLAEAEAKPLFVDVLSGLAHMHHHGFVHGDVKMENVLVDEAGHAVLTDFGATYATCSPQQCPRGTKTYAAPETRVLFDACGPSCLEISPGLCVQQQQRQQQQQGPAMMRAQLTSLSCQLRGCDGADLARSARHVLPDSQRYDGCKADMWCLGVMLLQMLTAMGMSDVLTILGECPVRLKAAGASEEAVALVLSLMSVDPLSRPSAGELLGSNAWVASVSACAAPAAPASV